MADMLDNLEESEPRPPVDKRRLLARVVMVLVLLTVAVTGMIYTLHEALTLPPPPAAADIHNTK